MLTQAQKIDALLPQTQCEQCGYRGCKAYAEAIAAGEADINRCPAGGDEGIALLSELTGIEAKPLNPECGEHVPPEVAVIDPKRCIGCSRCIRVCPTDAILGNPKHMHAVDADRCTGCTLCTIACPMDCVDMIRIDRVWDKERADQARIWFTERNERREKRRLEAERKLREKSKALDKKAFLAKLLAKKA